MHLLQPSDLTLVIDQRERRPFEFHGFKIRRAKLVTGDYTLLGYQRFVGVERKTAYDFAYYLGGNRMQLADQARRVRRLRHHLIIIEAPEPEFNEDLWRGAGVANLDLLKQTLRAWRADGLRIVHVPTHEQGALTAGEFLLDIANKYYKRHRQFFELTLGAVLPTSPSTTLATRSGSENSSGAAVDLFLGAKVEPTPAITPPSQKRAA